MLLESRVHEAERANEDEKYEGKSIIYIYTVGVWMSECEANVKRFGGLWKRYINAVHAKQMANAFKWCPFQFVPDHIVFNLVNAHSKLFFFCDNLTLTFF